MKAEELMIGDYVQIDEPDRYAGATCKILSLFFQKEQDAAYFNVFICGKFGCLTKEVCSDDIRPIPITPEILEKNGFEKVLDKNKIPTYRIKWPHNPNYYFTILTGMDCYWNYTGYVVTVGGVIGNVDFVHQLQHALRLCGINIKIKL